MRHLAAAVLALVSLVVGSPSALAAKGKLGILLDDQNGKIVVNQVAPDSTAASVGLKVGDVLVKIGKTKITNLKDVTNARDAIKENEEVPFVFDTPGGSWTINVRFQNGKVTFSASTKGRPKK